jgi:hypothetical protein
VAALLLVDRTDTGYSSCFLVIVWNDSVLAAVAALYLFLSCLRSVLAGLRLFVALMDSRFYLLLSQ